MTTAMDRYFEIVNSAGSDLTGLDGLGELFAEDVLLMDCGDMVRGRDLAVGVHREQAVARKGSTHQWTVSAQADGTLTGNWSRSGLDAHGNAESASGRFTASLGPDGRIALLHLTLTAG
ncbi:hypothetical protein OG756_40750 [Streptomyces sp. NBC_01310]|uniref:hypothetical protein n=1 Tax=Streptomyces sp. NBC_01310 TaxID=2903820 RepID=UPI0035B5A5DD|nr:hypothetical protein OG756_00645 [Streptomyces sp. NBC_01310]WSJ63749.1 hypothetical protein OG756_40750 [Streptomyces sp. NBC_01310]